MGLPDPARVLDVGISLVQGAYESCTPLITNRTGIDAEVGQARAPLIADAIALETKSCDL